MGRSARCLTVLTTKDFFDLRRWRGGIALSKTRERRCEIIITEIIATKTGRARTAERSSRRRLFEGEGIVQSIVGIPPVAVLDGVMHTEDELALVDFALVIFQFDGKAEPIPAFITGSTCWNVTHMGTSNLRYSPKVRSD